jgi:hypothetical protein
MAQLDPAPGKLAADGKEIIPTALLQDEAVTAAKQSAAGKIKRAKSNKLDTNVQHEAAGILYTTTAITITKVIAYLTTVLLAGNLKLDVGINGDDDAIVDAAALSDKANDSVQVLTIASGAVAAGKMVTASVETASGDASQTILVAIEYYENE